MDAIRMRYSGGLLGGGWMARLGSDLGNGRFDGTWLVSNFENLDPANTYWGKYYQLFSQVDSEAERFLDFERWWGSPTLLNGEEIEMIVDDLFIGNQLSGGPGPQEQRYRPETDRSAGGGVLFLRRQHHPSPAGIELDRRRLFQRSRLAGGRPHYRLPAARQHRPFGDLCFRPGRAARTPGVARRGRNHQCAAAGLHEMLIDDLPAPSGSSDVQYRVRFEPRRIADIHDDDEPARDDDREFSSVVRTSEINNAFYDGSIRPWLRQVVNEPMAEWMRRTHPFHQQQVVLE